MHRFLLFPGLFLLLPFCSFGQFQGNQSPAYPALVAFYDSVSRLHSSVEVYAMGASDYGLPIYLCVLNGAGDSTKTFEKARNGTTLFINNGIHPGEPDGINACGQIVQDYLEKPRTLPPGVVVAFTLCYNVGGAMVRSATSRANQDGPEEYGFRGNVQNLDLNRDFIKMDSENSFTFARIYHALDPDVFVDTHVSNGADYQYTLTLICSLKERMAPTLRTLTYGKMLPEMETRMRRRQLDMFPYVELLGETPDQGLEAFNDLPRYAMGYSALFHSISITTETHMLKPFEKRVSATKAFLLELLGWTEDNAVEIERCRKQAIRHHEQSNYHLYNYQRSQHADSLYFKGFEHGHKKSEVSGMDRLYYDRTKPYNRNVPYFNRYEAKDSVHIPEYYVVGAQCREVIRRLAANGVQYRVLRQDSVAALTIFRVVAFHSSDRPYEGHYLHRAMDIREEEQQVTLKKGDILIDTRQEHRSFLCSVLEPESEDSYFAWNFFDSYLQEKEYFSSYVFEDIAARLLKEDPALKQALEEKQRTDEKFRNNAWEQLYFVYQRSPYFEPSFMQLPVFKAAADAK